MEAVPGPTRVLLVGGTRLSEEIGSVLRKEENVVIIEAAEGKKAVGILGSEKITVVFCEESLPDGNWWPIQESALDANDTPVVVCCIFPTADFAAEVVHLGGYDILPRHTDALEVIRVFKNACYRQRVDRVPLRARAAG